jgi:hypothetical protein
MVDPALYPKDHQLGTTVPDAGASCATCHYLGPSGGTCLNPGFIRWAGTGKLPTVAKNWCCDLWERIKAA